MTTILQQNKPRAVRIQTIAYWGLAALAFVVLAALTIREPNLDSCAAIGDQDQRLACFDSLARQNAHRPSK